MYTTLSAIAVVAVLGYAYDRVKTARENRKTLEERYARSQWESNLHNMTAIAAREYNSILGVDPAMPGSGYSATCLVAPRAGLQESRASSGNTPVADRTPNDTARLSESMLHCGCLGLGCNDCGLS